MNERDLAECGRALLIFLVPYSIVFLAIHCHLHMPWLGLMHPLLSVCADINELRCV